jgi:hypothetical protein
MLVHDPQLDVVSAVRFSPIDASCAVVPTDELCRVELQVLTIDRDRRADFVELWWRWTMHLLHIFMGNNAMASFMQGTMDLGACGLCCTDCALFLNGF